MNDDFIFVIVTVPSECAVHMWRMTDWYQCVKSCHGTDRTPQVSFG